MRDLFPYSLNDHAVPGERIYPNSGQEGAFAYEPETVRMRDYWLVLRKRLWLIVAVAASVFVGTAVTVFFILHPTFTAASTLLIEPYSPHVLSVQQDLYAPETLDFAHDYYKSQYEIMASDAVAVKVMRELDLQHNPIFLSMRPSGRFSWLRNIPLLGQAAVPGGAVAYPDIDPVLLSVYLNALKIAPLEETRLAKIEFSSPDPAFSARVANAHAAAYIQLETDLRGRAGQEAGRFLKAKLGELKDKLTRSEIALNDYRRKLGIVSDPTGRSPKRDLGTARLGELENLLTKAQADRIALEAQRQAIQSRDYQALPTVAADPTIQALRAQVDDLDAKYASLLTRFTNEYPDVMQLHAQLNAARQRLHEEIQRTVHGIELEYQTAVSKEKQLSAAVEDQKNHLLTLRDAGVEYAILARDVETNRELYDSVVGLMKNIGVAGQIRISNVVVVDQAAPPLWPSSPQKVLCLTVSAVGGLLLGICLAFLLDTADDTFDSPERIEAQLRVPTLAVVPNLLRVHQEPRLALPEPSRLANGHPSNGHISNGHAGNGRASNGRDDATKLSLAADAYHTLRASILHTRPPAQRMHTLLFTSATPGEGKTLTAVNVAMAFAETGCKVALLDADFRRPRCHTLLQAQREPGLTQVLTGQVSLDVALQPVVDGSFFLLSAGTLVANPSVLLGSPRMHALLSELREHFDQVVIDSSPFLLFPDVLGFSACVDGAILVVRAHRTPHRVVSRSLTQLARARAPVLGIMLNDVDLRRSRYVYEYEQYYSSYYCDGKRPGE